MEDFTKKQESKIDELQRQVFGNHTFSTKASKHLKEIAGMLFSKAKFGKIYSGIVVAGFGEDQIFPCLESCIIECVIDGKLKVTPTQSSEITHQNHAILFPFAQKEMVDTFMQGIDPLLREDLDDYISKLFQDYPNIVVSKIDGLENDRKGSIVNELKQVSEQVFAKFKHQTDQIIRERYINPVLTAIEALPKDELAAMAESLVSLTSFKKRVTIDVETVGGLVDVAVISKGDGFVWVKRKSYFDPRLNPRHHSKYYTEPLLTRSKTNAESND